MMVIGLTGGIGCGKTTVAGIFKELGAVVIDADWIGRQILDQDQDLQQDMLNAFGHDLINDDGSIDRKTLGNIVFADPEKLEKLNTLIHPYLWSNVSNEIDRARGHNHPLIVVDAALIFEAGLEPLFDHIIVIASKLDNRIARIQKRDGLSPDNVMNRILRQMDLRKKIEKADWVIDNDTTIEHLHQSVLEWFQVHIKNPGKQNNNLA
jgi:dephospho-CoA kinase